MVNYIIFLIVYFALVTGIGYCTRFAVKDRLVARIYAIIVASFTMGLAGRLYLGTELGQLRIIFAAIALGVFHFLMFNLFTGKPTLLTVVLLLVVAYPILAFFGLELGILAGAIVGNFLH